MKAIAAIIAIMLVVLPVSVQAGEWFSWDETNTRLHVPLTMAFIIDTFQSYQSARKYYENEGFHYSQKHREYRYKEEANSILGKHPDRIEMISYMVLSYAITTAFVYILPEKWSHALQIGAIGVEVWAIENNYHDNSVYRDNHPDAGVSVTYSHGF